MYGITLFLGMLAFDFYLCPLTDSFSSKANSEVYHSLQTWTSGKLRGKFYNFLHEYTEDMGNWECCVEAFIGSSLKYLEGAAYDRFDVCLKFWKWWRNTRSTKMEIYNCDIKMFAKISFYSAADFIKLFTKNVNNIISTEWCIGNLYWKLIDLFALNVNVHI